MSDIELKPCPFCESENVNLLSVNKDGEAVCITSTDEFELIHDMQEPTYIHCYGCDMDYMPDSDKPEEVVDSWNTRKPMERIAEQLEELDNNGWIPVEERLPEDDKYILLSFKNFSLPLIGSYQREDDGGAFYLGDCDREDTCVANGLFVNAWMPLPEPYNQAKEGKK